MVYKRPRAASPSTAQKRPRQDIRLGTELPPDEDGDDGSFVPVWKQTVTDDRGRRRLHGAFTGGFSAGYFNTVGSKEGWAPKAFVSSRSNRNKDQASAATQRPEDFMDEEDLAQASESRHLETAQSVAPIGSSGGVGRPTDGFFGLFVTEEETMGVKVVHQMGWRRDQGVGRKVRRHASLNDGIAASKDTSEHFFAPKDAPSMSSAREEIRRKGLGYLSEARLSKAGNTDPDSGPSLAFTFLNSSKKSQTSKKPTPKKSSFGVGVLNDTGSDDEDPYELGPKITFNKTLGKEKKAKKPSKFVKPAVADGLVYVPRKATKAGTSLSRMSQDEKATLKGFTLEMNTNDLMIKPKFPPPLIPEGWKTSRNTSSEERVQDFQSVTDAARSSTLDAKARASLLGETPLPSRSIFDFIPKEARDRLVTMSGNTALPQGLGQSAPEGYEASEQSTAKSLWSFVPRLDKHVAAGALAKGATGWMPYGEDSNKRARYVGFLELKSGSRQELPERGPGMSVSEWAKELEEFAHAAQVFKPASGIMASRFISSKATQSTAGVDSTGEDILRQPTAKVEDPTEQAAKLGMYGPMTRSSLPFHPSRLLCKRFNVKPPPDNPNTADIHPVDFDIKPKTEEPISKSDMDRLMREVASRGPATQRPAWMSYEPEAPVPAAVTKHAIVDIETNEALSKERASEDVFKAIFGDDDDEE
ncbi:DUF1604-domain-containing protein [Pleomassaria siparia CBS 279.74]|uniref:DUF1604-domain-containing protein n=1 Tax=Pleomassaria siparia CBS 279.74 TaxID=1314801 RepID=A0A6G1K201_9PLEO|nr:DUF1604-domain-containing protein [Pleomassaria siparia CBS 279.74]